MTILAKEQIFQKKLKKFVDVEKGLQVVVQKIKLNLFLLRHGKTLPRNSYLYNWQKNSNVCIKHFRCHEVVWWLGGWLISIEPSEEAGVALTSESMTSIGFAAQAPRTARGETTRFLRKEVKVTPDASSNLRTSRCTSLLKPRRTLETANTNRLNAGVSGLRSFFRSMT